MSILIYTNYAQIFVYTYVFSSEKKMVACQFTITEKIMAVHFPSNALQSLREQMDVF